MSIRSRTKIGIARETTWGTAGTTWDLLAVQPPTVTTTYEQVLDQGLRGIAAKDFSAQQGVGNSEVSLEGLWHPEEIGHAVFGILGALTTTGTAAPVVHQFDLGTAPPSYTIEDQPALQAPGAAESTAAYQYKGMYINSLAIKFSAAEGAVGWTASLRGIPAGKVTASTLGSGTLNPPLLGWEAATVTVFGVTSYGKLIDAEINLAREVVMEHAAANTRNPAFGYSSELEVTGKLTIALHGTLEPDWYLGTPNTSGTIHIGFERGSGATLKRLAILIPDATPLESAPSWDRGAINSKMGISFRGIYNASISGVARITLTNAKLNYNA